MPGARDATRPWVLAPQVQWRHPGGRRWSRPERLHPGATAPTFFGSATRHSLGWPGLAGRCSGPRRSPGEVRPLVGYEVERMVAGLDAGCAWAAPAGVRRSLRQPVGDRTQRLRHGFEVAGSHIVEAGEQPLPALLHHLVAPRCEPHEGPATVVRVRVPLGNASLLEAIDKGG